MSYSPNGLTACSEKSLVRLPSFLEEVREPYDLLCLLERPLLINPSDLFAVVDCETRMRGYSGDRTVSAVIFFIDFHQEIGFRLDADECEKHLHTCFSDVVCAVIDHYHRPGISKEKLRDALRNATSIGCRELIHDAFERRFLDWKQMIRTARRMKQSQLPDDSQEYGLLSRGVIVADRIGNMLSHVRHQYCDLAFPNDIFTVT